MTTPAIELNLEFLKLSISIEGGPANIAKAAEELSELSAELSKYAAQLLNPTSKDMTIRNLEQIHDEMADVDIMMAKLRMILGEPKIDIYYTKINRHKREIARLMDEQD